MNKIKLMKNAQIVDLILKNFCKIINEKKKKSIIF